MASDHNGTGLGCVGWGPCDLSDRSLFINSIIENGGARPVINLKADSLISGGNGTQESPYTIG